MPPSFDLDKIKYTTDQSIYEKAVGLYESGKVTQVKEGIGSYSAVVLGSHPYNVSIEARRFGLGYCDCYLGQRDTLCKHIVALSIYAVMDGNKLRDEDKIQVAGPVCSGKLGELSKEVLAETKKAITLAMRYIKPYNVPSRLWFAYQNSLDEGCARLAKLVSDLPISEQTGKLLVDLLLRLDKKLCTGGVDDSNGTVGGFMQELVLMLEVYAKLDQNCIKAFEKLCGWETCFGWEEPLVRIVDEGLEE
ncbi:hypothetical protein KKE28_01180 [Patescibacteria group bacterium]|nr:hypothetical protein [Patescibacteria group bacterium]